MKNVIIYFLAFVSLNAFSQCVKKSGFEFFPVHHASFVIQNCNATIYVDPVGKIDTYEKFKRPDIILITHHHGDHLSPELIDKIKNDSTVIIGPEMVINRLSYGEIIKNGETTTIKKIRIEALPMYNTTPERMKFHKKGEGNGYVLTINGKRIYISGDTEDIPEMRNLKDIYHAFICMNLPYTMTVEQAASAVLEMKPKYVYPYHYRSKGGEFSDIQRFKDLVSADKNITVYFLKWYEW